MSISSLFCPNDYNIYANSVNTLDVEGINSILNIGTNTTETTAIHIGHGPSNPTPILIDGVPFPGGYVSSIGPISLTANNDGCIDTGGVFQLCTTSATQGGVLTNGAQPIGGLKTFVNSIQLPSAYGNVVSSPQVMTIDSSGNIGSENSSAILTLGPFGSTPNADGLSLVSGVLNMQPTDSTHPGGISIVAQNIAGDKTFINNINGSENINLPDTSSAAIGVLNIGSMKVHDFSQGTKTNTFVGNSSGNFSMTSSAINNTCIGVNTGVSLTTGYQNAMMGANCGMSLTTGVDNSLEGYNVGNSLISGSNNTILGSNACEYLVSGNSNVMVGNNCGDALTTNESSNIYLGFDVSGVTGESNATRIGVSQVSCNISGIYGNSPSSPSMVIINSTGTLGSQAIPSSGVLSLAAVGSTPNADAGTITGTSLTIQPADGTHPGVMTALAQSFGGNKTFNNNVTCQQNLNLLATTSSTVGNISIGGLTLSMFDHYNLGTNIFLGNPAGNYTITGASNIFIGDSVGTTSINPAFNVAIGSQCYQQCTGGQSNVIIGYQAGVAMTGAGYNTILGSSTASSMTQGTFNVILGNGVAPHLIDGTSNVLIGNNYSYARNYTGSETNNVLILNDGNTGESNVIRIGVQGVHLLCAIGGIFLSNVTSANVNNHIVVSDSNGTLTALENYNANPASGNTIGLGSATILTMTIRGVSVLTPFPITMDLSCDTCIVCLRIPQFSITSASGYTSTVITFSQPLAAGYRPLTSVSWQVLMVSGGVISSATNYFKIQPNGVMTLVTNTIWPSGNPFGLQDDMTVSYLASV